MVVLIQIFVPETIGATYAEVTNINGIRRYCHRHGKTLPGDIALQVQQATDGGWLIDVLEAPGKADS